MCTIECRKSYALHVLLVSCIFFFMGAQAQVSDAYWGNPVEIKVGEMSGDGVLHDMVEDARGFLWIATSRGLIRWDGKTPRTFTTASRKGNNISGNHCRTLAIDGDENLWIGTLEYGLNKYNPFSGEFTHYGPRYKDSLYFPDERPHALYFNSEHGLFAGPHRQGLCRYVNEKFECQKFESDHPEQYPVIERHLNSVKEIVQDPDEAGLLWVATVGGLVRFNAVTNSYKVFYEVPLESRESMRRSLALRTLTFMPDGGLYIGTWGGGLLRFDRESETFEQFDAVPEVERDGLRNNFKGLLQIDEQHILVGSPHSDCLLFDIRDKAFKSIEEVIPGASGHLKGFRIWKIHLGKSGMLYLASEKKILGFHPMRNQFRQVYGSFPGLLLNSALSPDGELFLFGSRTYSMAVLDPKTQDITTFRLASAGTDSLAFIINDVHFSSRESATVLCMDRFIYLKKSGGQWMLESVKKTEGFETDNRQYESMLSLDDHSLLIGTRAQGLLQLDEGHRLVHQFVNDPSDSNSLLYNSYLDKLVLDRHKRVWIGTEEGLSVYDRRDQRWYNRWNRQYPDDTLSLKTISDIIPAGEDWFYVLDRYSGVALVQLTLGGVWRKKDMVSIWQLPGESIGSMALSPAGEMWIATDRGVVCLAKTGWKWFDSSHGLPRVVRSGKLCFLPDGRLSLTHVSGVFIAHPDSLVADEIPTWLGVERLDFFARTDDYYFSEGPASAMVLDFEDRFFRVYAGYTSTWNNESLSLTYRLKGFQDTWLHTDQLSMPTFTNVAPGRYALEFKTVNFKGEAVGNVLSLPLEITPPFWKTTWFYVLIIFGIAALLALAYRGKVRAIRKEQVRELAFNRQLDSLKMRSLQVQMNPHFLFNSLNCIKAAVLSMQGDDAVHYINKFSKLLRHILLYAECDFAPLRMELDALKLYLTLEGLRYDNKFEFEIIEAHLEEGRPLCIPPMLLQPVVENAIRHGIAPKTGKGFISVKVERKEGRLIIRVEDDGVGRALAKKARALADTRPALGMRILEERLEILRKTYHLSTGLFIRDLHDDKGLACGTEITIEMSAYENCND